MTRHKHSGQTSRMCEGGNQFWPSARQFPAQLLKRKRSNKTTAVSQNKRKKIRNFYCKKSVKKTIAEKESRGHTVDLPFCMNFIKKWLRWLFVSHIRQLGSDSLKAHHLVITKFACVQTFSGAFMPPTSVN